MILLKSAKKNLFFALFLSFIFLFPFGCNRSTEDHLFTIGIISHMPYPNPVLEGFETGLNAYGYSKGDDLVLIYREISDAIDDTIDDIIYDFVDKNIDLLLTFENDITLQCKALTGKLGLPVLFVSNPDPIQAGLVETLSAPGNNLAGVRMPETAFKTLEWVSTVIPEAKRVYLPYNSSESTSYLDMEQLRLAADELSLKLVVDDIQSAEETLAAIKGLQGRIDAVLLLPSHALNSESTRITRIATELGLPTFASLLLDDDIMLTFTGDFSVAGKQAARLAHQIYTGTSPSEIPVEISDAFLNINLETAEKVGVTIPNGVLSLAKTIIR
jgi:putative ABC transport system substrate-binding protein